KAMRATAQDPEAARLMGINVDSTISLTFLLGGLLAGAAGLIYALYQTNVWFFQGFRAGLIAFTAAVMGGIGNLRGAVLGGLIIGCIQQISDNRIGSKWTEAIVFAYLILIMVFRPRGLNTVVGFAGLLDLGYVAFFAIGAYTMGWLGSGFAYSANGGKGIHVGVTGQISHLPGIHVNFLLVVVGAIITTAIAGAVIGLPTLRLRGDYIAIVTLAFGEIIGRVAPNGDDIHLRSY